MDMMKVDSTSDQPDAITLILPLTKKESISAEDFYDYWLNVHVTLPARTSGIHSIWLHVVDFDEVTWPKISGVTDRPGPDELQIHGIPEATFLGSADLATFQEQSHLQMDDGLNFLAAQIAYRSDGLNTSTLKNQIPPDPDGSDGQVRHILFLRRRAAISTEQFRTFVKDVFAPRIAGLPGVLKVRRHLFEEVELTLDHPGVAMFTELKNQYQAAVEVVVDNDESMAALSTSPDWVGMTKEAAEHFVAAHAAHVSRCLTTKYDGKITLIGVRGAATAEVIHRLRADNQTQPELSAWFLPG